MDHREYHARHIDGIDDERTLDDDEDLYGENDDFPIEEEIREEMKNTYGFLNDRLEYHMPDDLDDDEEDYDYEGTDED